MPEEALTLTCPTPTDKMEWLKALQSAIRQALKIDGDAAVTSPSTPVSEKSAQSTPPLVRSATYTFTKLAHLKDVTYTGKSNLINQASKHDVINCLRVKERGCAVKCKEMESYAGQMANCTEEASDRISNTVSVTRRLPVPTAPFTKAVGKTER